MWQFGVNWAKHVGGNTLFQFLRQMEWWTLSFLYPQSVCRILPTWFYIMVEVVACNADLWWNFKEEGKDDINDNNNNNSNKKKNILGVNLNNASNIRPKNLTKGHLGHSPPGGMFFRAVRSQMPVALFPSLQPGPGSRQSELVSRPQAAISYVLRDRRSQVWEDGRPTRALEINNKT